MSNSQPVATESGTGSQHSSIDDVLAGGYHDNARLRNADNADNVDNADNAEEATEIDDGNNYETHANEQDSDVSRETKEAAENYVSRETSSEDDEAAESVDQYGNEGVTERKYTEEEVRERINKAVRERLARFEKNEQATQAVQQHAAQNFEFDENSNQSWQQQLEQFVEHTVQNMSQKQLQRQQQEREKQAMQQFEEKFQSGMGRFKDFVEVVGNQPITDAMTIATRGLDDPAAFLYAASKRAPDELKRISQITDPYKQVLEMGKLEERLRKQKATTQAPKPLRKTTGDINAKIENEKKEPTLEELIAESDKKRRNLLLQNRGRR